MAAPIRHPYLAGAFAPLRIECDAVDIDVAGEIPADLNGTLFRNGPNPQYPPRNGQHHFFAGDGMVHAIRFEEGRVSYSNRWVRTERFLAERAAGEALYLSAFEDLSQDSRATGNPFDVANTNVVLHGGRLLALAEAASPIELDARTLDTTGPFTFSGSYAGPMTAHPKIDGETGELIFFGYQSDGLGSTRVAYRVADASAKLSHGRDFEAPYCSMMHDFAVTTAHIVFPVFPATIDLERIGVGGPVIAWEPELGSWFGVMPRDGSTDPLWFRGEASYAYHIVNAHSAGDCVRVDAVAYPHVPLFGSAGKAPPTLGEVEGRIVRWTFDLAQRSDCVTEDPVDDLTAEFPRIDERWSGRKHRHTYYAARIRPPLPGGPFDTVVHLDLESGRRSLFQPHPQGYVWEPVFAPGLSEEEGAGWLLCFVYRADEDRSELQILSASDVSTGPVATVALPVRVPFGAHGNWIPSAIVDDASSG